MTEVVVKERYYMIREVAEMLHLGVEKTRQLVMNEPGVLVLDLSNGKNPHARRTYRIPQSVVDRLIRRNTNPDKAA